MLDSLKSTLSAETVASFFTRNGKKPEQDELTIDDEVICLETEVRRPREEKKWVSLDDMLLDYNAPTTPGSSQLVSSSTGVAQLGKLDFLGPANLPMDADTAAGDDEDLPRMAIGHPIYATE